MSTKLIYAVDLFCGAGGTSAGLKKACEELGYNLELLAINHWDIAIATHSQNHPYAQHICENIDNVNPRKAVPRGSLDILIASPECTHHSNARGGKPRSEQSRASAWHILRWAEALRIENILIENVKEFQSWGPLGNNGQLLKSRKGETYRAFLNAIVSLGYKVETRILNAAYYGDPTTRERLFIIARRGHKSIIWPEPTHTPTGAATLFGKTKHWITAREIIDWSIPGQSIFTRHKPLSQNTMNRIYVGLKKFCGKELEPFLVMLYKSNNARSIDRPMPTVMTVPHIGVCKPFLVKYYGNSKVSSIEKPCPTITTKDRFGICKPFIVPNFTEREGQSPRVHDIDKPLPTVTGHGAGALVQPFIVPTLHGPDLRIHTIDKPMPTITSVDAWGLVMPQINGQALDIQFRMLRPHELARAMSFGDEYKFEGNRGDQVKQIGNAVPVMLAKNLCLNLLN